MSFSIVDSKIKNYTKPIQDYIIKKENVVVQPETQVICEPVVVSSQQTQPIMDQSIFQTPHISQAMPFPEKRKPFQLKSRERFQARRRENNTILQTVPQSQNFVTPVVFQPTLESPPPAQPVPLVQIPQSFSTSVETSVENQENCDEFGYSIDNL